MYIHGETYKQYNDDDNAIPVGNMLIFINASPLKCYLVFLLDSALSLAVHLKRRVVITSIPFTDLSDESLMYRNALCVLVQL